VENLTNDAGINRPNIYNEFIRFLASLAGFNHLWKNILVNPVFYNFKFKGRLLAAYNIQEIRTVHHRAITSRTYLTTVMKFS
jgi:hypothetical protein